MGNHGGSKPPPYGIMGKVANGVRTEISILPLIKVDKENHLW
jgi:hypothetical protein